MTYSIGNHNRSDVVDVLVYVDRHVSVTGNPTSINVMEWVGGMGKGEGEVGGGRGLSMVMEGLISSHRIGKIPNTS